LREDDASDFPPFGWVHTKHSPGKSTFSCARFVGFAGSLTSPLFSPQITLVKNEKLKSALLEKIPIIRQSIHLSIPRPPRLHSLTLTFSGEHLNCAGPCTGGRFLPSLRDLVLVLTLIPGLKAWAIFKSPSGTLPKGEMLPIFWGLEFGASPPCIFLRNFAQFCCSHFWSHLLHPTTRRILTLPPQRVAGPECTRPRCTLHASSIPKGLCPPAQGCPALREATL